MDETHWLVDVRLVFEATFRARFIFQVEFTKRTDTTSAESFRQTQDVSMSQISFTFQ